MNTIQIYLRKFSNSTTIFLLKIERADRSCTEKVIDLHDIEYYINTLIEYNRRMDFNALAYGSPFTKKHVDVKVLGEQLIRVMPLTEKAIRYFSS